MRCARASLLLASLLGCGSPGPTARDAAADVARPVDVASDGSDATAMADVAEGGVDVFAAPDVLAPEVGADAVDDVALERATDATPDQAASDVLPALDAGPHALTAFTLQHGEIARVFGDSLTAGGVGGPCGTSVKWQAYLSPLLTAIVGSWYSEGGAVGATMKEFAVHPFVVTDYKPNLAFIEFGTNDVLSGRPPADTAADLETGVKASWAVSPKLRFVILPVIAAGEQWEGSGVQDARIAATNAAIKAAADRLSGSGTVTFIDDMREKWFVAVRAANPSNDTKCHLEVDNLHFNDMAAHVVSDIVAAHLAP